jgi:leucine dehydrogenase
MLIEVVDTQSFDDFSGHEQVLRCVDQQSGLQAFIAIHNRNLGPALGGCRMRAYENEQDAITDVLRLSKGMTYKSALASLPLGGGKAVIIGDPKTAKTEPMLRAMGKFINSLKGAYISAEDSGTSVADLRVMHHETEYVAGIHERKLSNGKTSDGDPSPSTAYGVYQGIKASLKHRFKSDTVDGVRVAVQGVGNVGRNLVKLLVADGARVTITDPYQPAIESILREHNVDVVSNEDIHRLDVEVYAPCALGGALNTSSLVELRAPIVAGAANNQLANDGAGQYLFHKGTLYAPDFVINAGGIIDIFYERHGYDHSKVLTHIDRIQNTLLEIYEYSAEHKTPTHITAERLGESRFLGVDISEVA